MSLNIEWIIGNTMEDYKEKYEKLLHDIDIAIAGQKEGETKIVLQNIKELNTESEDERIKKQILSFLKKFEYDHYRNLDFSSWIAWFEKQGNLIKWQTNSKDNKPKKNHSILMQTTHGIEEGEWQGEQWYQYRWSSIVRDSDVLSWIELSELEKQGEQKTTWSEEDEIMLEASINFIKSSPYPYSDTFRGEVGEDEVENWLKSLKERIKGE